MNLQSIDRLQSLLARVQANSKRPRTRSQGLSAALAAPGTPEVSSRESAPSTLTVAKAPAVSKAATVTKAPVVTKAPSLATPAIPSAAASSSKDAPAASASLREPPKSAPLPPTPLVALVTPPTPPVAKTSAVSQVESLPPESLSGDELLDVDLSVSEPPPAVVAKKAGSAEEARAPDRVSEVPIEDVSAEELGAEEISIEIASEVMLEAPEPASLPAQAASTSVVPKTFTAPPMLDELTFSEPPPALPAIREPKKEASVEPPPASSAQRISDAPGSIDAAILAATEAQGTASEPEVPAVTPPPESGPQIAVPPMPAPHVPSSTAGANTYRAVEPTMEQLGDVVELEPPSLVPLELAERRAAEARKAGEAGISGSEELEFVPQASEPSRRSSTRDPMQTLVGGFTEEAGSEPKTAVEKPISGISTEVGRAAKAAPSQELDFGDEAPTASSPLAPQAVARPVSTRQPPIVDVVSAARGYRPQSFAELLDASIGLLK